MAYDVRADLGERYLNFDEIFDDALSVAVKALEKIFFSFIQIDKTPI